MLRIDIIIVFSLCLLLDWFVIKKFIRRKELNVFDVLSLFYTLYFVLIPIKCVLKGTQYRFVPVVLEINETITPALLILIFKLILFVFNWVVTVKEQNNKYFNFVPKFWTFTGFINYWNKNIILTRKNLYGIIIILLFSLYPLITQMDTIEQANGQKIVVHTNFFENLWFSFVKLSFPTAILLNFKYVFDHPKKSRLAKVSLAVSFFVAMVGSRTMFLFVVVEICLYVYAVNRKFFTTKRTLCCIGGIFFIVSMLFPILYGFRTLRNINPNHTAGVIETVTYMSNGGKLENFESLKKKSDARSFGLYQSLYEAETVNYLSTKGDLLADNLKTLVPIIKPNSKYAEIYSKTLEGGGDIGESVLMCFYFDLGVLGVIIAPLFYVLYFAILSFFSKVINKIIISPLLNFLLITTILRMCCNIEMGPYFRTLWNPTIIVFLLFAILFKTRRCK